MRLRDQLCGSFEQLSRMGDRGSPSLAEWHPTNTYISGGTEKNTHEVRRYTFIGAVRPTPNQYAPYADQLSQVVHGYQPNLIPILEEVRATHLPLWSRVDYARLQTLFQHLPIEQLAVMPFGAVHSTLPLEDVSDAHFARLRGFDQVGRAMSSPRLCSAIAMRFAMEGVPYAVFSNFSLMAATSGFRIVKWAMLEDTSFVGKKTTPTDISPSFELTLKVRDIGPDFHMVRKLTHPILHDYLALPLLGL